jgi:hypothetical protein
MHLGTAQGDGYGVWRVVWHVQRAACIHATLAKHAVERESHTTLGSATPVHLFLNSGLLGQTFLMARSALQCHMGTHGILK